MKNKKSELFVMFMFCITIITFILSEYAGNFFSILETLKVKHFFIIAVIILFGGFLLKKYKYTKYKYELKRVLKAACALFFISIIFQLINFSFKLYTIREMYYLIVPIIFVWIFYNYLSDEKYLNKFLDVFFYTITITFFIRFYENFSISNIMNTIRSFSLTGISSSAFESGAADIYALLLVYYLYRKDKLKICICAILGFLSSKRQAMLFIILILIAYRFIPKNKSVNKKIFDFSVIFFTIMPTIIDFCTTNEFAIWFYNKFSMSISEFSMTRVDIINIVKDANLTNYGLGTITNFLEIRNVAGQLNMHSDLLRLYMECTIIGVILYVKSYLNIAKYNYLSFILMIYFFFGISINHLIGPGSITVLILLFFLILYFNKELNKEGKKIEK